MKFILLVTCILGVAVCAPQRMFVEFEVHRAPSQMLPADVQKRSIGGSFYPADFDVAASAGAAPPCVIPDRVAPGASKAPVAPTARVKTGKAGSKKTAKPRRDDDDDDDDD